MASAGRRLRLVAAFRRWDADGDGLVSEAELQGLLSEAGLPEESVRAVLAATEKSKKESNVDYDAFVAWVFSGSNNEEAAQAVRAAAAALSWPGGAAARLSPQPALQLPEKLKVAAPVPCKDSADDFPYWSVGGAAKARVRVTEGPEGLKLGAKFTVGVHFRVPKDAGGAGGTADYDSLLMGHDSKHWLAVSKAAQGTERRLCFADGRSGDSATLRPSGGAGAGAGAAAEGGAAASGACAEGEWTTVFLQPKGEKATAVLGFDEEGLFEIGSLEGSLVGSKLEKLGWADGEAHIADVVVWPRLLSWREMASVHPLEPPPPPPAPTARARRRTSFQGQVIDTAGRGVPGVEVHWPGPKAAGGGGGSGGSGASCKKGSTMTDEDGWFEATLSDAETDVPEDDDDGVGSAKSGSSGGAAAATAVAAPAKADGESGDLAAGAAAAADAAASGEGGASSSASKSAPSSGAVVLSFSTEGFAPAVASVQRQRRPASAPSMSKAPAPSDEGESFLRVTLRPVSASSVFDAKEGGAVVDEASGSSLTVPPDSLAYPDGSPVEGPVTVSLSVIDVTDPAGLASMPGDFSAVGEGGASVFLESLGAAWVGATDKEGRELAVKEDSEGLALDLKSNATGNPEKLGADPELWTFNEATGKWELETTSVLKLDGLIAPNSALRAGAGPRARRRGPKKRMKGKKYQKGDIDFDSDEEYAKEGGLSAEEFRKKVTESGTKTLSTNLKKVGYINCDIAYMHPTLAVLLKGIVLGADRRPIVGAQLWSVGRDYGGRCPDVAKEGGAFDKLVGQFDSKVDIEVHLQMPPTSDSKLAFRFSDPTRAFHKLSREAQDLLSIVRGKYTKDEANSVGAWTKKDKRKNSQFDAVVEWCERRHRWQVLVHGKPVFVRDSGDGGEQGEGEGEAEGAGLPFGGTWRTVVSTFRPADLPGLQLLVPSAERPSDPKTVKFGPFDTGPAGEIVDVGELVVTLALGSA